MSDHSNKPSFIHYLPAYLAWLVVIALPILAGILVRYLIPAGPVWIPWVAGVALFAVLFVFVEWVFKPLRWLLIKDYRSPRS